MKLLAIAAVLSLDLQFFSLGMSHSPTGSNSTLPPSGMSLSVATPHSTQSTPQFWVDQLSVEHLQPDTPGATLHGIDIATPRFGWVLSPCSRVIRSAVQTAYRILVVQAGQGQVVWDSGKTASNRTQLIRFDGQLLISDTLYSWKVRAKLVQATLCPFTRHV